MKAIAIVLLCIASAVVYGILHDQITARLCVEYFTIGQDKKGGKAYFNIQTAKCALAPFCGSPNAMRAPPGWYPKPCQPVSFS